jgi:hypothetical protein
MPTNVYIYQNFLMKNSNLFQSWQEDLWLRRKWNFNGEETKELFMKEICFMIDDEQM